MAQCTATTTRGTRCKISARGGSDLCARHGKSRPETPGGTNQGADLIKQHHAEDLAYRMAWQGSTYTQIARALVIEGIQPYSDHSGVRLAVERAAKRQVPPKEKEFHRWQGNATFNELKQGLFVEIARLPPLPI